MANIVGIRSDIYNILLVGETGSGKTSFLNLLCNCGLVQALGFTDALAQLRKFNDLTLENALANKMESKTRDAKLYNANLNDMNGIIDTLGFGGYYGIEDDKAPAKRIVDALKNEEYIYLIVCAWLSTVAMQARMSASLRYALSEVTAVLPKQVLGNVIVVFTHAEDQLDLNFNPKVLNNYFGRELESERIFLIENPYCRFGKAKVQVEKLPQSKIARSLNESFDKTGEVLTEICTVLKGFKQVHTHHFATLYDKKQEVERKVMGLLTEYDNQTKLEQQAAQTEQRAQRAVAIKSLNSSYNCSTNIIERWRLVATQQHNLLCGAKGCYSNCQINCYIRETFDKKALLDCACMTGEHCRVCGHHYTLHFYNEGMGWQQHEENVWRSQKYAWEGKNPPR